MCYKGTPVPGSPRWNEADRDYVPPGAKKPRKQNPSLSGSIQVQAPPKGGGAKSNKRGPGRVSGTRNVDLKEKVRSQDALVSACLAQGVAHLRNRLCELDMSDVETPCELLQGSKRIVAQHKDLTQRVSSSEAEVAAMEGKLRTMIPYGDKLVEKLHCRSFDLRRNFRVLFIYICLLIGPRTPPPPPADDMSALLSNVAAIAGTTDQQLQSYLGEDLSRAMGNVDKNVLLETLKNALRTVGQAQMPSTPTKIDQERAKPSPPKCVLSFLVWCFIISCIIYLLIFSQGRISNWQDRMDDWKNEAILDSNDVSCRDPSVSNSNSASCNIRSGLLPSNNTISRGGMRNPGGPMAPICSQLGMRGSHSITSSGPSAACGAPSTQNVTSTLLSALGIGPSVKQTQPPPPEPPVLLDRYGCPLPVPGSRPPFSSLGESSPTNGPHAGHRGNSNHSNRAHPGPPRPLLSVGVSGVVRRGPSNEQRTPRKGGRPYKPSRD
uniref:Protein kinase domain-containing protein n=1 Tax=Heterorhabditis bacteriophora TaxID=37862 RepID=A0A1I7XEW6_HETBA